MAVDVFVAVYALVAVGVRICVVVRRIFRMPRSKVRTQVIISGQIQRQGSESVSGVRVRINVLTKGFAVELMLLVQGQGFANLTN